MRTSRQSGSAILALGSILIVGLSLTCLPASAHATAHRGGGYAYAQHGFAGYAHGGPKRGYAKYGSKGRSYAHYSGGLQCVPFARNASGIDLVGNAWTWWDEAAGTYERGATPEPGSVLAFRSNGSMRLGHVAVVSRVINARQIEIDHSNWASRGSVSRGISVVDVSPQNDWTAVRVEMGQDADFGSIYPTYGFIYGRPDRGTMVAGTSTPAPQPDLNPAPRDLRPAFEQDPEGGYDEVAEAPAPRHHQRSSSRRRRHGY